VGVCENDKTDFRPLERKRSVPFDKLLISIAMGNRDKDAITSLAGRLAKLDREIDEDDRRAIETVAEGMSLRHITNKLLDALDPDKHFEKAKEIFETESLTAEQAKTAAEKLAEEACAPFDNRQLRNKLIEIKSRGEQIIDTVSEDRVIYAGFDEGAKERAKTVVGIFKRFIEENKDELTALQIIYSKPYERRHATYEDIKQLAEAIKKPPYNLTPELLWQAYEQLEKSKVRRAGPQKLLTNIISLIRFTIGESNVLEPFSETVDRRFNGWLTQQERVFSSEQMEWLNLIKDHIATSLSIEMEDFEYAPFHEKGGPVKVYQLFGNDLNLILEELNERLAA